MVLIRENWREVADKVGVNQTGENHSKFHQNSGWDSGLAG
jgi:hypothetical protein